MHAGFPRFIHGFLKSSASFFNSGQFANRVNQRKPRRENKASICCLSAAMPDSEFRTASVSRSICCLAPGVLGIPHHLRQPLDLLP